MLVAHWVFFLAAAIEALAVEDEVDHTYNDNVHRRGIEAILSINRVGESKEHEEGRPLSITHEPWPEDDVESSHAEGPVLSSTDRVQPKRSTPSLVLVDKFLSEQTQEAHEQS